MCYNSEQLGFNLFVQLQHIQITLNSYSLTRQYSSLNLTKDATVQDRNTSDQGFRMDIGIVPILAFRRHPRTDTVEPRSFRVDIFQQNTT